MRVPRRGLWLVPVVFGLWVGGCAREAAQSFDEQNGSLSKEAFDAVTDAFGEVEDATDGLGTHFNDSSCAGCHLAAGRELPGGSSKVTELRAGHVAGGVFVPAPGGTLVTLRALAGVTSEEEALPGAEDVRERFVTPSLFGDGLVEAVADDTLRRLASEQRAKTNGRIQGLVRVVDVLESPGTKAVGRFGWAAQHASLLSFSADAYRNEMGITSRLEPNDNTFLGQTVDDGVADPEDTGGEFGEDVERFAAFMRALAAPPRLMSNAAASDIAAGAKSFDAIGCSTCHATSLVTAPAGTVINGGRFTVPAALGQKTFHPFGDFLLHDIGTGSRIVREGVPADARNRVRTAALWGLGTRLAHQEPLLHDGSATTIQDAIQRHRNSAAEEAGRFQRLSAGEQTKLLAFLKSL